MHAWLTALEFQVGCEISDVEKPEDIANAQILIFPGV